MILIKEVGCTVERTMVASWRLVANSDDNDQPLNGKGSERFAGSITASALSSEVKSEKLRYYLGVSPRRVLRSARHHYQRHEIQTYPCQGGRGDRLMRSFVFRENVFKVNPVTPRQEYW